MSEEIDIALGFDQGYAPHAAVVIASLVRQAPGARFRFIVLHTGVDRPTQAQIELLAPGSRFHWAEVSDDDLPAFENKAWISRATLFRLGLEKLAPADCKKVLYLDSDLAVQSDVRELWDTGLDGRALAAVIDAYIDPKAFAARWGLAPDQDYFNAGILLIDLEKVRAEGLFAKAIAFVAEHNRELPFSDQDALNWAFWGKWTPLDLSWNVQRHMVIKVLVQSIPVSKRLCGRPVRIVHYTGADKPWIPGTYHPLGWLYWRNLRTTPFWRSVTSEVGALERARTWLRWVRWQVEGLFKSPPQKAASATQRDLSAADETAPSLSLIVCTRNRALQLTKCLEALARLKYEGNWELIVVDNGSSDDTRATIMAAKASLSLPLHYVYEGQPGLGRARNAGLRVARGRIVAFTDDDCYPAEDFLTQAERAFEDPTIGYVTGRVLPYDPRDAAITINTSEVPRRYPARSYVQTDWIIGANLAFRHEVLIAIGGFDPLLGAGTPFAAEDVDATSRASSAGWAGAYRPEMVVVHNHGRNGDDAQKLLKTYDIGRGAYHLKLLLRGEIIAFLRGVYSLRWRFNGVMTPLRELYGAAAFGIALLKRALTPTSEGSRNL